MPIQRSWFHHVFLLHVRFAVPVLMKDARIFLSNIATRYLPQQSVKFAIPSMIHPTLAQIHPTLAQIVMLLLILLLTNNSTMILV